MPYPIGDFVPEPSNISAEAEYWRAKRKREDQQARVESARSEQRHIELLAATVYGELWAEGIKHENITRDDTANEAIRVARALISTNRKD